MVWFLVCCRLALLLFHPLVIKLQHFQFDSKLFPQSTWKYPAVLCVVINILSKYTSCQGAPPEGQTLAMCLPGNLATAVMISLGTMWHLLCVIILELVTVNQLVSAKLVLMEKLTSLGKYCLFGVADVCSSVLACLYHLIVY